MNTTNFPESVTQPQTKTRNFKNLIIGILGAGVVAMGGYIAYDKNKTGQAIKQQDAKIEVISTEKSNIQTSFDASLARLDSLSTVNTGLQSQLAEKNSDIAKAKTDQEYP